MKQQYYSFTVCIALSCFTNASATDTSPKTEDQATASRRSTIKLKGLAAPELKDCQVWFPVGRDSSFLFEGQRWNVGSVSVVGPHQTSATNSLLSNSDLKLGRSFSQDEVNRGVRILKDFYRSNKKPFWSVEALVRLNENLGELHLQFMVAERKFIEPIGPGSLIYDYPRRTSS